MSLHGGDYQKEGRFSYRLQGPSLIIEYGGQDLGDLTIIFIQCTGIPPMNMELG